jgi:excisionase family DNA binding protein
MNIEELARYLELDESVLLELVKNGKIPVVREGENMKFERSQIDHWAVSGIVK